MCERGVYVVREVGEEVRLECEISGHPVQVPLNFIKLGTLRLFYACTIASIQGQTVKGRLRVFSNHDRFGLKHLFVCSSRATNAANLEIV